MQKKSNYRILAFMAAMTGIITGLFLMKIPTCFICRVFTLQAIALYSVRVVGERGPEGNSGSENSRWSSDLSLVVSTLYHESPNQRPLAIIFYQ